ncbi:MAG: phosphoribosyltransferase [Promethearchaeota archaeon]|nr:MAG: phosphoribosyltransferase [Candidatus Lokiarchaeota archaeon]
MKYKNRIEAGKILADKIKKTCSQYINEFIILAIPRGGLPVAYSVSEELNIPLHLVITKKLSHPTNPEIAIGAIAADGSYELNERIKYYGVTEDYLGEIKAFALKKVKNRIEKYCQGKQPDVKGKKVFVIDDGIATGYTALVAGKYLKNQGANLLILAIPVCPISSLERVKQVFDDLVCPIQSKSYSFSVGAFYDDFHQNTDEELYHYLEKAKKNNLLYETFR